MKIFRFLLFAVIIVSAPLLGFSQYLGAFKTVSVEETNFGPLTFIYSTHRGPLAKLSVSWSTFLEEAHEAGIDSCSSLAVYLDAPSLESDQSRVILGCRLDAMDDATREAALTSFPSFGIPKTEALTSTFPFKNVASFFVGPRKVYPAMEDKIDSLELEQTISIELYSVVDSKGVVEASENTLFVMPLDLPDGLLAPLEKAFD